MLPETRPTTIVKSRGACFLASRSPFQSLPRLAASFWHGRFLLIYCLPNNTFDFALFTATSEPTAIAHCSESRFGPRRPPLREFAIASVPNPALLADAIVVACSVPQDVEMEMLGVGRVRARPQDGGEPATGGLSHCPREQGFRGIRLMADGDTSPIGERDCGKIDGDALGMRVRITARKPDRAAATVAAGSERDNARAEHRGSKRRHQILRKLRESAGECAIENRTVGQVDRSAVGQADRAQAHWLGNSAIGEWSRRGGYDFGVDVIRSELGETRCRISRLRDQRRRC